MEGLRDFAVRSFSLHQEFSQSATEYDTIRIFPSDQNDTSYITVVVSEEELLSTFSQTASNASFKLVRIIHADYSPLQVKNTTFIALFKSCKLDSYMLYLLSRNVYGFYRFESNRIAAAGGEQGDSYFLNTSLSTTMWSFNRSTRQTRAILLTKNNYGKRNARERFQAFQAILASFKHSFTSPCLLAAAACVEWSQYIDDTIGKEVEDIRDVEAKTGHGNWTTPTSKGEFGLDEISNCSRRVGKCLATLSNQGRHLAFMDEICEFVVRMGSGEHTENDGIGSEARNSSNALTLVVDQLSEQIKWARGTITYLSERAKAQSSVVRYRVLISFQRNTYFPQLLGLMTHDDATSNLRLANITLQLTQASVKLAEAAKTDSAITIELAQASVKLAEAAKRDSSAMKTIAIMTMAFLPATFFAALFSVPMLDWGSDIVVQERFWVYWAFTLPFTALVFGVWLLLSTWPGLWRIVREIWQRKGGPVELPTSRTRETK